jgi:hypothetical protein
MTVEKRPFQSVLESHKEHVHAIGMISIELANLELFMGQMLAALIGIDPYLGEIIYLTPKTGIGRIAVLENAMDYLLVEGSTGHKYLGSLLGKAKAVMQRRHDLIHVVWAENAANTDEVCRLPLPLKHDPPKSIPVPIQDLTNLIRDIRLLVADVQQETRRMGMSRTAAVLAEKFNPPSSSPPKSSEPPTS